MTTKEIVDNNMTAILADQTIPKKQTNIKYLLPALKDIDLKPKAKKILAVCMAPEFMGLQAKEKAQIAGVTESYYHRTIRLPKWQSALIEQVKGMLPNSLPTVFKALRQSAENGSDKAAIAILTQAGVLDKPGTQPVTVNIANIEAIRTKNLEQGLARFNVQVSHTGGCPAEGGGTADIVDVPSSDISDIILPDENKDGQ